MPEEIVHTVRIDLKEGENTADDVDASSEYWRRRHGKDKARRVG